MNHKERKYFIWGAVIVCIVALAFVIAMTIKNTRDLTNYLENSIREHLVSVATAASEVIDVNKLDGYNSHADVEADQRDYDDTLRKLRGLAEDLEAEYIYVLKEIDGKYEFVFDTDPIDEEIFIPYDLAPVHEAAFNGEARADVMNVDDEFGTFNTGAVPLWLNGKIIGIVAVDIEDELLVASNAAAVRNEVILIVILAVLMIVVVVVLAQLLRRVSNMQTKLEQMAHYDTITGLPNSQYLLEYMREVTERRQPAPFALFFIDLDNFKKVNDNAGHDAGDELLRHIAQYLQDSAQESGDVMSFRPSAGILNIAARVGGDEFIQIVQNVKNEEEASKLARDLLGNFQSLSIDKYISKYNVGLSIGVALYPYHSDNYHVLIKYADVAMYHAKRAGKNDFRIYSDEMAPKEE